MAAQHMLNPKGRLAACLVTLSLLAAARSASISQVETETQIWGGFVDGLAVSMVEPKLYDSITAKGTPIKCDAKSVANSGFDPRLPTKIITHGWMCNVDSGSGAFNIKNQFLSNGRRANVILVNWYKLFPVNVSVGTTIGAVGKRVACLVAALLDAGARLEDIHLIGHSMGSHIMGYAGSELKKTRGEVAIITGLDANSDGFIGKFHILSKNDGKFVYNFHTGGGMLGGKDPIAQIDIFYNGGNHPQPHCSLDIAGVCSHCLAFEVFIQSMYDASLVATKCSSWKDFQNGLCASNEQIQIGLGINPQAEGSYFISADIGTNRAFSMCANWFVSNPPYEK